MFTIEGTHGTAACYATNIEEECVEQIRTMLGMPFAEGANTAIMPDVRFGIGCTIGTTMRVADAVVPNLVGIYSTSVNERTIDEAPGAYKPIKDIIGPIADAVDIIDVMRPIYNFKAS